MGGLKNCELSYGHSHQEQSQWPAATASVLCLLLEVITNSTCHKLSHLPVNGVGKLPQIMPFITPDY